MWMLPIVLADNNAEYTERKLALPAIIHLATIISLQYLLCHVMQFCIQTTKSCEERSIELWARTDGRLVVARSQVKRNQRSVPCSLAQSRLVLCKRLIGEVVQSRRRPQTRALSWLKAVTSAFTFKTLLRHYAKRALTPQLVDVKLGHQCKSRKGGAG